MSEDDELSEYEIEDGAGGTYTVQLNTSDAESRGLTGGKKPEDKSSEPMTTKAQTPANKARTPRNK